MDLRINATDLRQQLSEAKGQQKPAPFAAVPAFEFDFGGTNVTDAFHELGDEAKSQPWKSFCIIEPKSPEESVYVSTVYCDGKIYMAEAGNAGPPS